jgi:hypothetical protein
MPNLERLPGPWDDGDWVDAYTGERFIGEWETRDGTMYDDVKVELDEGQVMSATCCGERASPELLKDLIERYEDE